MGGTDPVEVSLYGNVILFFIALVGCGIFSFLETSITALRLFKLKELAEKTTKYKSLFLSLEYNPNQLLNSILIANNLTNVIAATSGSYVLERLLSNLPESISFSLSVLIITAAILVFGEIIPKNIAKSHGEKLFSSTLWFTNVLFFTLSPFVTLLIRFTNGIIALFGGPRSDKTHDMPTEKEIKFLINYIDEYGLMESEKTSMLQSIFELGTTPVKDIMAPAPSIIRIEAKKTVADAYEMFIEYQFTRLPVYKGNQENIVGMLHLKDIIAYVKDEDDHPISTHIRPILFIPESMKINQLLKEFRSQGMHIAIVINEHGSITGLATLEDVLEKIVGEIRDEYESTTTKIISLDDNSWLVDARIELDEVEKLLETSIECESGITLGGFLIEHFQHLPKKGERLSYKTFTFQVQQATKKQILQVLIFTNTDASIEEKKES